MSSTTSELDENQLRMLGDLGRMVEHEIVALRESRREVAGIVAES